MRPREPHDWKERAIADDPTREAFYRHREWFTLWSWQGPEWRAARGKLERQAAARLNTGMEEWRRATERLGEEMGKTADAPKEFGETWVRLERQEAEAAWFRPWIEQGRTLDTLTKASP